MPSLTSRLLLVCSLAIGGALTVGRAQEMSAAEQEDLRQRIFLALSAYEAPADSARVWGDLPLEAIPILVEFATNSEAPVSQRAAALGALAYFQDPEAARVLRAFATDGGVLSGDAASLPGVAAIALARQASGVGLAPGAALAARSDETIGILELLLAGTPEQRRAAIDALGFLDDAWALDRLGGLMAASADSAERLQIAYARVAWIDRVAEPGADAASFLLAVTPGEQRAERVEARFIAPVASLPDAQFEVRLACGNAAVVGGAPPVATMSPAADHGLAASWELDRLPGARDFWVGVELWAPGTDGQPRPIAARVRHVFRPAARN